MTLAAGSRIGSDEILSPIVAGGKVSGTIDASPNVMHMNKSVQTKREIFKTLSDHSAQLKRLGVKKLGLFGSFVRDEQTLESGIDLLVQFEPDKKNFDNFMDLSGLLEDLLQRRVEIVTTEALSPYIGPHIMNEVE